MKKHQLFIILNSTFLILNSFCFAQKSKVDSLLTLLKTDKPDTNKVRHLNALGWLLMYQNPDTAIVLSNQALGIITPVPSQEFTSAKDRLEGKEIRSLRANTLCNLGTYYWVKADYLHALGYYLKALKIDEELKNKKGIARCLGNIGNVYWNQADYSKASDYYFKALKMEEELKDKNGIANQLGNLGMVFDKQADYPKALEYYFKALKIKEEIGNKNGRENTLGNIGIAYHTIGDYPKALNYYFKSLILAKELGDNNGIARNLTNIGAVYKERGDFLMALDYFFKALEMAEELGNKNLIAGLFGNIGSLYTTTGKFKEAEHYLKRAIALNDSIGANDMLRLGYESISQLYDTTGRNKLALINYKKAITLKDSLFSQENKKQLIQKEMNYEFDKKEAATKAENDKKQAVAAAEKQRQRFVLILVSCVLLLVFLFAGFIFRSLQITHRQKNIIELQKNEVLHQKEIVEKQKEKIVDSINYAQRIQQSILMEESEIQNYLTECFIYYQPKDIVSGDFYWCSKIDDKIILAAVDCTGHGVPGAFMSMIGNTLLNQIINEKHITKPSEILQLLNLGVYEALHQKKDGALSDDGMDISLCCIDYINYEVQFAGAQNPLYVVSGSQIEVVKGDIHGIGGGGRLAKLHNPVNKEFTNYVIPIKKDMSIYLFSDGYKDQFGGSNRKKFGTQKFKELLLNSQHLSMQKQKESISSALEEWKGDTAQIDDILVVGVRL